MSIAMDMWKGRDGRFSALEVYGSSLRVRENCFLFPLEIFHRSDGKKENYNAGEKLFLLFVISRVWRTCHGHVSKCAEGLICYHPNDGISSLDPIDERWSFHRPHHNRQLTALLTIVHRFVGQSEVRENAIKWPKIM